MLSKLARLAPVALGIVAAQICTTHNPSACPVTGTAAGPPTLQSFVSGAASSMAAAGAGSANLPQPHMIYSGEVAFASQSYMVLDPKTCPLSGTCSYNNPAVLMGYADSLANPWPAGVGLKSIDLNIWLGPGFTANQYLATGSDYCGTYGTCYTPGSPYGSWYSNSLTGTYDVLFPYVHTTKGVRVRVSPAPSGDLLTTCGITQGSYTEAQVEACVVPLYAAFAARYWIDDFTVLHEPCGAWGLMLNGSGCAFSVSDADTFIQHAAAAVRATSQNPNIQIGAGALISDDGSAPWTCPNSNSYWCDWVQNLLPAGKIDFVGIDFYPVSTTPVSQYTSSTLSIYQTMIQQIPPAFLTGRLWANESSMLRWSPLTPGMGGDANTYWGCGYIEWQTDGTAAAWIANVAGAWAAAHGFHGWSLFPTEPLIYVSTDPNNTHCTSGTDGYDPLVAAKVGGISAIGLMYGAIANGHTAAIEGGAHITGRAHIGQ